MLEAGASEHENEVSGIGGATDIMFDYKYVTRTMRLAPTADKTLEAYEPYLDDRQRRRITEGADKLAGARVAHVNSTASGGGVAEILHSLVPLLNDAGVDTD